MGGARGVSRTVAAACVTPGPCRGRCASGVMTYEHRFRQHTTATSVLRGAVRNNQTEDGVIGCQRVEVQVLTTLKCNLRCSYCSLGAGEALGSQRSARYTAAQLAAFVERHLAGKEVYFTLYGGEPTLNTRFALQLMERLEDERDRADLRSDPVSRRGSRPAPARPLVCRSAAAREKPPRQLRSVRVLRSDAVAAALHGNDQPQTLAACRT